MSSTSESTSEKKLAGRPKTKTKQTPEERKAYQKEYMKQYHLKHRKTQIARRNTCYYVNKFNLPPEFAAKYGIYTCEIYKCQEAIKKMKEDCPEFLNDIKQFLLNIIDEKNVEVADENK